MNSFDYYLDCLKNKYAEFSGRARRSEYWYFALFNFLIAFAIGIVDGILGTDPVIGFLYFLAVLIPSAAVAVRRLHDTSRSGWWLLIGLIPVIGAIVLLVFMVEDSHAANEYGPNPKDPAAQADIIDHLVD